MAALAIWGPYFTLDNKAVECVQRRATKLVGALKDCTYTVSDLRH